MKKTYGVIGFLCGMATFLPADLSKIPSEEKPIIHIWNDSRVRFSGSWYPVVAHENQTGLYAQRSDQTGDSVELDFCGTMVGVIHLAGGLDNWQWGYIVPQRGHSLGLAEIKIDGRPVAALPGTVTIDAQGRSVIDTSLNGRTLLAKGLTPGRHRLTVTNLGIPSKADGTKTIAVKGFWVDTELLSNVPQHHAWRFADTVRSGEGWRAKAVELATAVKTTADLSPLIALVEASAKLDAALAPLRMKTVQPDLPIVRNERTYWTPSEETKAYLARLAKFAASIQPALDQADQFRYDAANQPAFQALLNALKQRADGKAAFFKEEIQKLPPILFYTGTPLSSGAAPNYIWQSNPHNGKWGCSIRTWDPAHPELPAKTIFADTNSLIFDLTLSYDAKTVFFSMRRNREQCWHIYEIGADGQGLKQITSGPAYDVSPVPLPDGRIAFISSRTRNTHTVCQSGPSTHLYRMNRDGSDIQDLSANTLSDFGLSAMADGRLLFTRWEYVDVNLSYRQSLWTERPDGTQFQLWFGNTILDPATFWQAREIPSRYAAVCTFAPHHGTPRGAIGLVSNRNGMEAPRGTGFRWITQEFPAILDVNNFWSYCDPYPVHENRYLVSYGGEGANRFRLFLLDDMDNKSLVYDDPSTSCFGAQPFAPRPEPARLVAFQPQEVKTIAVPTAPPGQPFATNAPLGRLMLTDIYRGLPASVPRGSVKSIRIMEQMPKTVNRTWYFVMDQGPLMSASTYYAKRVWGYAPVEADGSAYFEAPAKKEIYLQACDAEGREIQRMTSALFLMPGETQGCAGCHESRQSVATPADTSLAAKRAPTPLAFPQWGNAGVLDYNRIVQPVLDRNCVSCHKGANPPKGVLLTGDYTRFYNMSYNNLVIRMRSEDASRQYYCGFSKEKPMTESFHLLTGIMLPFDALKSGSRTSRLPDFFKPGHCKKTVSAGDLRIVYEWLDAMIPYYPTTDFAHREALSNRDKWADKDTRALLPWFTEKFAPLYNRRCASCHGQAKNDKGLEEPRQWAWLDLTHPEISPALTAHLAKEAGGRGIPAKDFAFKDTADPDYQAMLKAIQKGGKAAYELPEADMPGFVNRSQSYHFPYRGY